MEAHLQRIGHRHDLHDALVEQALDALPDCRLGQADGFADGRVRTPAVLLELLDDRLRHRVERDRWTFPPRHGAILQCLTASCK